MRASGVFFTTARGIREIAATNAKGIWAKSNLFSTASLRYKNNNHFQLLRKGGELRDNSAVVVSCLITTV
jgi:hypothetical protein